MTGLAAALDSYKTAEFQYGTLDCCLFVANLVQKLTGKDYAERWRGQYADESGAKRMIDEYGTLAGIASAAFGDMQPMADVRDGSPVLIGPPFVEHDSISEALGICYNSRIYYLTEKGLAHVSLLFGRGCWHV